MFPPSGNSCTMPNLGWVILIRMSFLRMENNQQRITADYQRLTRKPQIFFPVFKFCFFFEMIQKIFEGLKPPDSDIVLDEAKSQTSFFCRDHFLICGFVPFLCPSICFFPLTSFFDVFLLILTDIRIFIAEQKHERTILHLCVYLQFCSLWRTVCMERVKRKGHDSTIQGTEEIYNSVQMFKMAIFLGCPFSDKAICWLVVWNRFGTSYWECRNYRNRRNHQPDTLW